MKKVLYAILLLCIITTQGCNKTETFGENTTKLRVESPNNEEIQKANQLVNQTNFYEQFVLGNPQKTLAEVERFYQTHQDKHPEHPLFKKFFTQRVLDVLVNQYQLTKTESKEKISDYAKAYRDAGGASPEIYVAFLSSLKGYWHPNDYQAYKKFAVQHLSKYVDFANEMASKAATSKTAKKFEKEDKEATERMNASYEALKKM